MITEIKNRMKKYGRKRCSDTRHLTFAFDVQRSTLNNEQVQYRHRLQSSWEAMGAKTAGATVQGAGNNISIRLRLQWHSIPLLILIFLPHESGPHEETQLPRICKSNGQTAMVQTSTVQTSNVKQHTVMAQESHLKPLISQRPYQLLVYSPRDPHAHERAANHSDAVESTAAAFLKKFCAVGGRRSNERCKGGE